MASLEEAQGKLRLAAQGVVLSMWDDYSRLGCKLVPEAGPLQRTLISRDAAVKAGYRKLILLIHPDKNQGSERSELATKALQEIWGRRLTLGVHGWTLLCGRNWLWPPERKFLEAEAFVKQLQASGDGEPSNGGEAQAGSSTAQAESSSGGGGQAESSEASGSNDRGEDTEQEGEEDFDQEGEDFEQGGDDPGEEGGSPPKQTDPEALTVRWEPVNVQALDEALNLDAVRRFSAFGLYDVLHSLRLRARHIRGKVGWVAVAEEPGKAAPGMVARRYSGIRLPPYVEPSKKRKSSVTDGEENKERDSLIAKLPPPLQYELRLDIHEALVGKSAFAFTRLVRYVCRKDLGMLEVDAVNAYFQLTVPLLPGETLQRYLDQRDALLGEVCYAFGVKRDQAKQLFIALGFGGSLSNWCSKVLGYIPEDDDPMAGELMKTLQRFQAECRRLHRKIRAGFTPEQRAWFKDRSDASAAFSKYEDMERRFLDVLIGAAGKQLVSGEHDGVCIFKEASQKVLEAAGRAGVAVACKELPNPWEFASQEHSEFDWYVPARMPYRAFSDLRKLVGRYARQGEREVRANTADLVRYVAEVLSETVNVPNKLDEKSSTYEYFTGQGFWVERHGEYLHRQIQDVLQQINRHPLAHTWTPPKPFNRVDFAHGLVSSVLGYLGERTMPSLDGARINGLLLCRDGYLLDFTETATCRRRRARPSDRLGFVAKALSDIWQPKNPSGLGQLVRDFLETKAKALEDNEPGRRVIEEFERLLNEEKCPVLSVLKNYAILRENVGGLTTETIDWNWILWVLRFIARSILGEEHLCEMLYLFGGGSSGKDVLNLLIFAVLGLGVDNLGVMLPGRYLVAGGQSGNENASPLLARMERKRAVWVSEVPRHTDLNEEFVKPFCEQGGAPVPARKLNKAPRDFVPTSVLIATSNHPAQVQRTSATEDNGWDRRLRLLETRVKFTAKTGDLHCNEMKADDSLKARVNLGHYNASLLFFVGELFPTLKPRFNEGSELIPKPASMEELEREFASKQSGNQFKDFIKTRCVRVEAKTGASLFTDFCKELKLFLGDSMQMVEVRKLAKDNGFASASTGSERVVINADGPWRLKTKAELEEEQKAAHARRAAENFFAPHA